MVLVEVVQVKIPQVIVRNSLGNHVIDRHQDFVGLSKMPRPSIVPTPDISSSRHFRSRLATISRERAWPDAVHERPTSVPNDFYGLARHPAKYLPLA